MNISGLASSETAAASSAADGPGPGEWPLGTADLATPGFASLVDSALGPVPVELPTLESPDAADPEGTVEFAFDDLQFPDPPTTRRDHSPEGTLISPDPLGLSAYPGWRLAEPSILPDQALPPRAELEAPSETETIPLPASAAPGSQARTGESSTGSQRHVGHGKHGRVNRVGRASNAPAEPPSSDPAATDGELSSGLESDLKAPVKSAPLLESQPPSQRLRSTDKTIGSRSRKGQTALPESADAEMRASLQAAPPVLGIAEASALSSPPVLESVELPASAFKPQETPLPVRTAPEAATPYEADLVPEDSSTATGPSVFPDQRTPQRPSGTAFSRSVAPVSTFAPPQIHHSTTRLGPTVSRSDEVGGRAQDREATATPGASVATGATVFGQADGAPDQTRGPIARVVLGSSNEEVPALGAEAEPTGAEI